MRPGALLFAFALTLAAAHWAIFVRSVQREEADLEERLASEDVRGRRAAVERPRGPTEAEVRRLEEALADYRPGPPPAGPPWGLAEERPGVYSGRLAWEDVQDLFAWAAGQRYKVQEIEVKSTADDPARAACRVVLSREEPR